MPQQRIHDITSGRVSRLKASVNEQRALIGEKLLTAPDIIEEALRYFEDEHLKAVKPEAAHPSSCNGCPECQGINCSITAAALSKECE